MKGKGFSVIELMLVIAVAGILVAVAMPAFSTLLETNKVKSALFILQNQIQTARESAVFNNTTVTMCPLFQGKCTDLWSKGYSIFYDQNANRVFDPEDTMVSQYDPLPEVTLLWNPVKNSNALQYDPTGTTHKANQNGTFSICSSRAFVPAYGVIINRQGRMWTGIDKDRDQHLDGQSSSRSIRC
ncbi:GspH/FimT family pseudopilin [Gynuella sp.]|uniref:GspH/FimT family pseudopilin n=1 Tax=Gynuella sp. TaxID=2969146 RepID=UPI003D10EEA1